MVKREEMYEEFRGKALDDYNYLQQAQTSYLRQISAALTGIWELLALRHRREYGFTTDCPSCGCVLVDGDRFCWNCGKKIKEDMDA